MKKILFLIIALLTAVCVHAQGSTPVGLWKTIDDSTGQARSLVRITEDAGVYSGRIEKLLRTDGKPPGVCEECTDERKDKPIVGLLIIRNVRQSTTDPTVYDGGDILDPENGKDYHVRLKPTDGGSKLEVRGYIGMPLFGRTQTWIRVE